MKIFSVFGALTRGALFFSVCALLTVPGTVSAESRDESRLKHMVRLHVEAELREHNIPGAVVVIVSRNQVRLAEGYGAARLSPLEQMTTDTVIRAGSISKLATAIAILQLVGDGRVDLDHPANSYLQEPLLPGGTEHPITIRHLLTHTAGFSENVVGLHTYERSEFRTLSQYVRENPPETYFPPGQLITYSSEPAAILGLVVENVTGASFHEYMRVHVFGAMGMNRTTFVVDREQFAPGLRQAVGYRYIGPEEGYAAYPYNYVLLPPGIALRTTADDMARFLLTMLNGGEIDGRQIIGPAEFREFVAPQVTHYAGARGRGLGPAEQFLHGYRALFHDGNGIGFTSRVYWVPGLDFGIFVSVNYAILEPGLRFSDGARAPARLVETVLARLFPPGSDRPADNRYRRYLAQCPSDMPSDPEALVGTYRPANYARHSIQKLFSLFLAIEVENSGGDLAIEERVYRPEGPCLYAAEGGATAFFQPMVGAPTRLFMGTSSYERIPWAERQFAQLIAVLVMALASLASLVSWIGLARGDRTVLRIVGSLAATAPVALTGALLIWLFAFDPQEIFFGTPPGLQWLRAALVLTAVVTLGMIMFAATRWRRLARPSAIALMFQAAAVGIATALAWFWGLLS